MLSLATFWAFASALVLGTRPQGVVMGGVLVVGGVLRGGFAGRGLLLREAPV